MFVKHFSAPIKMRDKRYFCQKKVMKQSYNSVTEFTIDNDYKNKTKFTNFFLNNSLFAQTL